MCAFGWITTLSGVVLGGYLVFHTKRDPTDPFITVRQPEGEVFNIEDEDDINAREEEEEAKNKVPSLVKMMGDKFRGQMDERQGDINA